MAPPSQKEFSIDFGDELPPWDFFPIHYLAKRWHCSIQHIFNLIESGEIKVSTDLRNAAASRAMIRIPRKSVVEFLNRRSKR